LSFRASLVDKAHLAQAAGALNYRPSFGVLHQGVLQTPQTIIVKIASPMPVESWQLDEDSFHPAIIRRLRIYATYVYVERGAMMDETRITDKVERVRAPSPNSVVTLSPAWRSPLWRSSPSARFPRRRTWRRPTGFRWSRLRH